LGDERVRSGSRCGDVDLEDVGRPQEGGRARGAGEEERAEVRCGLGFGAAIGLLACGRACGAWAAEVLGYCTSGDVSGEGERVVGYAVVAVWEPGGGVVIGPACRRWGVYGAGRVLAHSGAGCGILCAG
jgi:hypothetical protein